MEYSGSKPGKGEYQCVKCKKIVIVKNDEDTLEKCPRCKHNMYVNYS